MPKAETTPGHFGFRVSAFFRPSDFGLRVWDFALTGWWYCPARPMQVSFQMTLFGRAGKGSPVQRSVHAGVGKANSY